MIPRRRFVHHDVGTRRGGHLLLGALQGEKRLPTLANKALNPPVASKGRILSPTRGNGTERRWQRENGGIQNPHLRSLVLRIPKKFLPGLRRCLPLKGFWASKGRATWSTQASGCFPVTPLTNGTPCWQPSWWSIFWTNTFNGCWPISSVVFHPEDAAEACVRLQ